MQVLILIPARGGSKGIPRKALRTLAGKPLIHYSIKTALKSTYRPDVYVTSDDEEILYIAKKLGAKTYKRPAHLADDKATLDPVIYDAYTQIEKIENRTYDLIVTLQPTSPLLKTESLDAALSKMAQTSDIETMISAQNDTHLTWRKENNAFVPNYKARVNRQFLPQTFRETGGFLITRREIISEKGRIGQRVDLHLLSGGEQIDIDTHEDWSLCEYYLQKKRILFCVSGYREIGMGHVYNTLILANEILDHQVEFLVDSKSDLAEAKIADSNYKVHKQKSESITDDILALNPDIVINDRLDTDKSEIEALKKHGIKVINFEDLGSGAICADLVINAIYPEKDIRPNHYFGRQYVVLRQEFMLAESHTPLQKVKNVLIAFGGTDANNYTCKVLKTIYPYCREHEIKIDIVMGLGYDHADSLGTFTENVKLHRNIQNIAHYFEQADIVFTSAGRTTYEVASIGVPTIVLAQNERELTHFFASEEYGFLNLGHGLKINDDYLFSRFRQICENKELREHMSHLMKSHDLRSGKSRVMALIRQITASNTP